MPNPLDDLFQWAVQQPQGATVSVNLEMTSDSVSSSGTDGNLVSYGEGTLTYNRSHVTGRWYLFPYFSSGPSGITQYFSDRRPAEQFGVGGPPFDPNNTDPLSVTISAVGTITVHSSKYNHEFTLQPSLDSATNIIYATNGPNFFTLSLCNRQSVTPPK
jgi:hypothetical protein